MVSVLSQPVLIAGCCQPTVNLRLCAGGHASCQLHGGDAVIADLSVHHLLYSFRSFGLVSKLIRKFEG